MKKLLLWLLTLFFAIAGMNYFPSVGSVILFSLAVFVAPIKKIRTTIGKKLSKGLQFLLVVALFFVSTLTVPQEPSNETSSPDTSVEESLLVSDEISVRVSTPDLSVPESIDESVDESIDESIDESSDDESNGEAVIPPENSTFEVHFIDVGQADAALVICDGKTMLIDGGNKGDSSKIYTYLKKQGVTHLDYIVGTHAHEDHIGGIPGALNLVSSVGKVYCPVTEFDSKAFADFKKYVEAKGKTLTVPTVGEEFSLGSAKVKILGCDPAAEDPNNTSIVLKITYKETSFLFTGDAERDAEQKILDSGYDLSATVLKVGHHGADTSTTYPFLREILPEIAIISVGEGNSYGHPTEATLSKLEDADAKIYRTDLSGDIIITSDGKSVTVTSAKNPPSETSKEPDLSDEPVVSIPDDESITPDESTPTNESKAPEQKEYDYILNKNTKKFHYPGCSSANSMNEENKIYFQGTRDEAISQGYDPCGRCKP